MALAGGGSFTVNEVTNHLRSNAEVIAEFLPVDIGFEGGGWVRGSPHCPGPKLASSIIDIIRLQLGGRMMHAHVLGAAIHRKRIALGLTQQQLADMAGLSRQSLNGIEQGTVNATLDSLCKRRDSRLDSCGQAVATTAQTAPIP
ncbi:helix-turn-helix transcriptional regulator [Cupriavidus sp. 8B]